MERASFRSNPQELHSRAGEVGGIGTVRLEDHIKDHPEDTVSRRTSKRINSSKQAEASRLNGARSKGPKSGIGKKSVRLNALKDGTFSNEVVVESTGERLEDFEAFGKEMRDFLLPCNPLEEILVNDIIANQWRRLRVRRCEAMELDNKLKAQETRDHLELVERVQNLETEFLVRFQDLIKPGTRELRWQDRVREQLACTSLGMKSLVSKMKGVEEQVRLDGCLSRQSEAMMMACGVSIMTRVICEMFSADLRKEIEGEEAKALSEIDTTANHCRNKKRNTGHCKSALNRVLLEEVRGAIAALEDRQKTLESVELMEARTRAMATLIPSDSVDRFSRAETAYERRMYRALMALHAFRGNTGQNLKLPG